MNYIGSKYSLLDFIHRTISDVTGYKPGDDYIFADLFAGTGVVGASYRKEGCKVISNDIQYYSYVINKYLIEGSENIDESLISSLDLLEDVDGFIFENYCAGSGSGRNYFTDSNGKKCDGIRIEIERLFNQNLISEETYFGLLAGLVNSIDKYANTASVYGAFLKHIKKSAQKQFKLELLPRIQGPKGEVYNEDVNKLISEGINKVQFVIMHPPYWDIVKFSENPNDLSNCDSINEFLDSFGKVIDNSLSVLEKNRYCAVVIGDKYANSQVIPLGFYCMNLMMEKGFLLKAILVKNFGETKGKSNKQGIWRYRALASDFYIFKHEYIFVFKKII